MSRAAAGSPLPTAGTTAHGRLVDLLKRHPVPALWCAWSLVLLAAAAQRIAAFSTQDPDDYMRLMQVRDLLAGQSWFDVRQYRMNPPVGAEMHWSRLVDVPLALALSAARVPLAEPAASIAAMIAVPLLQLLLLMGLTARLVREFGGSTSVGKLAVAIVPLFPLLSSTVAPLRIDHHGWQGVAALGCAVCLVRAPDRRAAVLGGVIAAAWLAISLEGLPLVVCLAALYGGRYLRWRDRSVTGFLAGLALASPVMFVATRPLSQLRVAYVDAVAWPHLAAFALAAGLMTAVPRLCSQTSPATRAIALLMTAGAAAATIIFPSGMGAVIPFADLDPVMRDYWYDDVREGLPITRQALSTRAMLLWTPAIVIAGLCVAVRTRGPAARRRWVMLASLALAAAFLSLLLMRVAIVAQILAVPFAAVLISGSLPHMAAVRSPAIRTMATAMLVLVATPAAASVLFKSLDRLWSSPMARDSRPCELARLAALGDAHLFTTMDIGPEILVRTNHTVVTSGYHRNMDKMREVTEAFSGDPVRAEALVRKNRPDYVVLCLPIGDATVYRSRRPDNLANRLARGAVPSWLEPVGGFTRGPLRVYRLHPQAGTNSIASPFMQ